MLSSIVTATIDVKASVAALTTADRAAIRSTLETAGVTFTNGEEPGIWLKRQPE